MYHIYCSETTTYEHGTGREARSYHVLIHIMPLLLPTPTDTQYPMPLSSLNIRDVSEIQLYCPYRVSHIIHSAIILIVFAIVSGQGWAHDRAHQFCLCSRTMLSFFGVVSKTKFGDSLAKDFETRGFTSSLLHGY